MCPGVGRFWPLTAFLVAGISIAEPALVALGMAAQASLLATAETAASGFVGWKQAVVASLGYTTLVFAVNYALKGEKRRLSSALEELATSGTGSISSATSFPRWRRGVPGCFSSSLRQVSEDGRRARQVDRVAELHDSFQRLVRLARAALGAHAVL